MLPERARIRTRCPLSRPHITSMGIAAGSRGCHAGPVDNSLAREASSLAPQGLRRESKEVCRTYQFRLPKKLPHETFLTTVKSLLVTAEAQQELPLQPMPWQEQGLKKQAWPE